MYKTHHITTNRTLHVNYTLKTRYTNGQQVHEKMLNTSNHEGNANQNHNELSPNSHQLIRLDFMKKKKR